MNYHNKIGRDTRGFAAHQHFMAMLFGMAFFLVMAQSVYAISVVPGLKGYGVNTPAGRGGAVYKVTNLNNSGTGSLRACVEASGPRVCIFETSGTIRLTADIVARNPYLTVAGQTAPSPGVMLRDAMFLVQTHDVLIQHIAVRPGDRASAGSAYGTRGTITVSSNTGIPVYNVIVDHYTGTWSVGDTGPWGYNATVHDITYSNSLVAEALNQSFAPEGPHSMSMLIGSNGSSAPLYNVALIGNIFSDGGGRNPLIRANATKVYIANHLVYNSGQSLWGGMILADLIGISRRDVTLVNSKFIPGVNTTPTGQKMISALSGVTAAQNHVYVNDIIAPGATSANPYGAISGPYTANTPTTFAAPAGYTPAVSASNLETYLLPRVGSRPADRHPVDTRIINEITNRTGQIINCVSADGSVRCQKNAGGWPAYAVNTRALTLPASPNGDSDGDGYTNLEEWLHGYSAAVEVSSTPTPTPPATLKNNVPVSNVSGTLTSKKRWTFTVPAGATKVTFKTTGGTGDADLFVRRNAAPSTTVYDYKSDGSTATETIITTAAPLSGTWNVLLYGYTAYSGVTITASYTSP